MSIKVIQEKWELSNKVVINMNNIKIRIFHVCIPMELLTLKLVNRKTTIYHFFKSELTKPFGNL